MPLRFPRRFGAGGDSVELQYVAALLQTTDDKQWRSDHTVTAIDIQRHLSSRHGFRLECHLLQEEILHQLAGTRLPVAKESDDGDDKSEVSSRRSSADKKKGKKKKFNARKVRYHGGTHFYHFNDEPVMDLVQLAALLMIPELLQIRQEADRYVASEHSDKNNKEQPDPMALVQFVLEILREELAFITPQDELLPTENAPDGTGANPFFVTADDIAQLNRTGDDTTNNSREQEDDPSEVGSATAATSPQDSAYRHHDTKSLLVAAHKRPIRLNRRVLIQLLRAVGEDPAHWTHDDLDEMLELAHTDKSIPLTADSDFELDAKALLEAVTADVEMYPVDRVNALSTHYKDVMSTVDVGARDSREFGDERSKSNGESIVARSVVPDEEEGMGIVNDRNNNRKDVVGVAKVDHALREFRTQTSHFQNKFRPPLTLGTSHERIFTLASLDQAADTQRSRWWSCISWLTLVVTYFAFFVGNYETRFDHQTSLPNMDCKDPDSYGLSDFGCETVNGIVQWVQVFLELSILGTAFMILSQLGNNIYAIERQSRRWVTTLYSLVGIGTVTCACILSYFYELRTNLFNTEGDRGLAHVCSFGLGVVLIMLQVVELARLYCPLEKCPLLGDFFVSGALKREQATKRAARFKMERLLTNAVGCYLGDEFEPRQEDGGRDDDDDDQSSHSNIDGSPVSGSEVFRNPRAPLLDRVSSLVSSIDRRRSADAAAGIVGGGGGLHAQALMHYHDHIDATEMTGGLRFFWRNLLMSRSLIWEEGIWLSNRLITANVAQWIIAVLVVPALFIVFYILNDEDADIEAQQQEHDIQETHVVAAIFVGGVAALLVSWLTAVVYIPSGISTTLQMRSGYLGSTFEQRFQLFRKSPDRATALFGSALWGSVLSAALAWGIFGGLVFVFLWTEIREEVMAFLSSAIGFTTTFMLKWILLKIFRKIWFSGLYRTRPGAANIMHLVLECWNLGLSSGFMLLRVVRLVLTAIFYVGRIDTPFLAEGVGVIWNSPLDSYPMAFRRDLIIHEAHRHPWVERLGTLYMMKLQHGRNFGRRGGAAWRTVFLLALLPWLRKHRQLPPVAIGDGEKDGDDEGGDMYGLDSLKGKSAASHFYRRKAVVMAPEDHDPRTRLMVENQNLVTENHALRRQVMEMAYRLNRDRKGGTWRGIAPNSNAGRSTTLG